MAASQEGSKSRGVLITALATLIVGVLTLVASVSTTVLTLNEGQRREDTQARGAARVLIGELIVATGDLQDLGVEGRLRRFGPDYPVEIPDEDLRLIASRLSTAQWNDVSTTLSDLANFDRLVRARLQRVGPGRLPSQLREYVVADLRDACEAQAALQGVADVEGVACPTLEPRPE